MRDWEEASDKKYSYDELTALAGNAERGKCFIDPANDSFLNPACMPEAICSYCRKTGQHVPETHGEIIRCALESLALKYRETLEEIRQLHSGHINRIHVIGGGTKNKLLCTLTANATKLPVLAGPVEATAMGNILMQAKAIEAVQSLKEIRLIAKNSTELVEYKPQDAAFWDAAYERFLKVKSDR